ncbi:MAG: pyruvate dehydrogenase (acetyl-transferring) E1 component subunit alpha [Sphingomonadales bacterium]
MVKIPSKKNVKKKVTFKKKKIVKAERYDANIDELKSYYKTMLKIRRFEEKAGQMYGMGLIGGFCHLYIGQEAVVVGIQAALENGDGIITGYRDHGHMIACGIDGKAVLAELTGRSGGISRGKGGSMHMFSVKHQFFGGHGIVGAQVPLGAGIAFANKYKKNGKISVSYFGDGASNQGQVYETFNMAKLWNLPVLFIIENNQYAMGTELGRATGMPDLWKKGDSFGIPGAQVDGMDVLAVKAAADRAVKHVRADKGPFLLEMKTYRYRGHSMSDPAKYRSKEEVQQMKAERDPIEQVKQKLIKLGAKEDELKTMDKNIKAEVLKAANFAENSPEPSPSELYTDILAEE